MIEGRRSQKFRLFAFLLSLPSSCSITLACALRVPIISQQPGSIILHLLHVVVTSSRLLHGYFYFCFPLFLSSPSTCYLPPLLPHLMVLTTPHVVRRTMCYLPCATYLTSLEYWSIRTSCIVYKQ